MIFLTPQNVNSLKLSVTTSAGLYALMDTAGSTTNSQRYYSDLNANAVIITPEDGDIRFLVGGTPTTTTGTLISQGSTCVLCGIALENLNIISATGSTICTVQIFRSEPSESSCLTSSSSATAKSYDAAVNGLRVEETSPLNQQFVSELLASATNQAATTYYYPSSAGMIMDGYKDITFEYEGSANETLTFEVSNDSAFTVPKDITKAGLEMVTNVSGGASFGNVNAVVKYDNLNVTYIRAKLVTATATNSVKLWARRKAL